MKEFNSWVVALIIIMFPIMGMYDSPFLSLSYGEISIFIIILLNIFKICNKIKFLKEWLFLLFYMIGITLIMTLLQYNINYKYSIIFHDIASISMYFMFLLFLINIVDFKKMTNLYISISFLCSIFAIIQFIVYKITNIMISGMIPILTIGGGTTTDLIVSFANRPMSFFSEPAAYAKYMIVPYVIIMFSKKNFFISKKLYLFVSTVALIVTFSGNAIIVLATSWIIYIFYNLKSKNGYTQIRAILLIILIPIVMLYLYNTNEDFNALFSRVNELTGNSERISGYVRITRGFEVFNYLNPINKMLGIGLGNLEGYIYSHGLNNKVFSITNKYSTYLNSFQYFMIYGGIVGIFIYMKILYKRFKVGSNNINKVLVIQLLAVSLVSSIINTPMWLVIILFIEGYYMEKMN